MTSLGSSPAPGVLCGLIIYDRSSDSSLSCWSFPTLTHNVDAALRCHSGLLDSDHTQAFEPPFRFSRFNNQWQYILNSPSTEGRTFSICILSTLFDPLKFADLCSRLGSLYSGAAHSPIPVLQAYLSIFTTGSFSIKGAKQFDDSSFDSRKSLIGPIKKLVQLIGAESIHIWTACMLKKRIMIYSPSLTDLQLYIRAFPAFVWHRQTAAFDALRPICTWSEGELVDLQQAGVFIVATTDKDAVNKHNNMYDLFVDLSAKSVLIHDSAKSHFPLTKFHKQTCELLIQGADEAAATDQQIIKAMAQQNKTLFENILALRTEVDGDLFITIEGLGQAGLPANMDTFVFNVALAEGWTK